jgi:predicted nucleotidyltransferase
MKWSGPDPPARSQQPDMQPDKDQNAHPMPVQTGGSQHEAFRQRYGLVVKALVDAFAARLKTVVLFGSQARGDRRRDSDHDLFVVIEDLPGEPVARQRTVRMILLPILDQLPGDINFIAKTPEEVAANLTPLLLDVCVDGVCLYGGDYFEPYRTRALNALHESKLERRRVGGELMWFFPQTQAVEWELSWEGYRELT